MCSRVAGKAAAAVGVAGLGLALVVVKDFHQQAQTWDQILSVSVPNLSLVWATKVSRAGAPHPHRVSWTQPVFLTCVAQSIQQLPLHVLQLPLDLIQPEGELLWVTLCCSNQTLSLQEAGTYTWVIFYFEQTLCLNTAPLLCAGPGCPARAAPSHPRHT